MKWERSRSFASRPQLIGRVLGIEYRAISAQLNDFVSRKIQGFE
jgi:hypothetical protein